MELPAPKKGKRYSTGKGFMPRSAYRGPPQEDAQDEDILAPAPESQEV